MTKGITQENVEEWLLDLPHEFIDEIDQVPPGDSQFRYFAGSGGCKVFIQKRRKDGPLNLTVNISFEEQKTEAIRDNKTRFLTEIESVLTNCLGFYVFEGPDGETLSFDEFGDEFEQVRLSYWIYSDGATKHTVNTAIIDMICAVQYVLRTASRLYSEPSVFR